MLQVCLRIDARRHFGDGIRHVNTLSVGQGTQLLQGLGRL